LSLQEEVIKRATYGVLPYPSPRQFLSRGLQYLKNQRKKQKRGFPIKNFGNDGGGVIPEWFYRL